MAAQPLGQLAPDTVVKLRTADGELVEFIVFHQGAYDGTGTNITPEVAALYEGLQNTTQVLRNDIYNKRKFNNYYGEDGNLYSSSTIKPWLESTYVNLLSEEILSLLREVTVPWIKAVNSSDPFALAQTTGKVFLPSTYELLDKYATASERKAYYNSTATAYWTRDGNYRGMAPSFAVKIVSASGGINGYSDIEEPNTNQGTRPLLILDANQSWVTDDGEVVANTPPAITGTDGDLGTFGETSPTYAYTVTDQQGGTVSVTEALDGTTLRTYTVTLGQQNTLTIPAATYLTTLNGTHTLTITATDSVGASTVRTETFTKNVTSCAFTQTDVFAADDMPTRCVVTIQGSFPKGSTPKVEICNNGNDASPAWEDITQPALYSQKYFFKNQTKTASTWGVKLRASLDRGTAEGDCNITHIGGVFQ